MRPDALVWFGLLGPLSARHSDAEIVVPPRLRALLAALLLRAGRLVSVAELVESVWDNNVTPGAQVTLRSYVKRLRQVLGPVAGARVVTRGAGYLIEVNEDELDLLRFGSLFRAGDAALRGAQWQRASDLLIEALGLWRGAALADVPSEALKRSEVPRLEELRLQSLEWRIEADIHLGRSGTLVPELQSLVMEHPLRERFHAQLLLALVHCGRRAEALDAYQRARRLLVEELAIEPGPELRDLHRRVLAGDPELAAHIGRVPVALPHQLPIPVRLFAGRTTELRELAKLLDRPAQADATVVIASIDGTAGVGKTALALHWAHQVANRFPDGQLYINLRGFDPSGTPLAPAQAIRMFLDAFGVPAERIPTDLDAQSSLYRSLLAGKRALVVLDNARDADQVRPLLPASAGCLAVVTSRAQLASLAVDTGAHVLTLDVLNAAEASELLARRVGAERIAKEATAAAEISDLCARLPLALAIAAARAAAKPAFPLAVLATDLRDMQGRLDALDAGSATSSMRAVISWSYCQLSEPAARMFRLLGVHPGPDITIPAAASLAHVAHDRARCMVAELTRAQLMTEHVPGRFGFHDLLRAYAIGEAQSAEASDSRRAVIQRMLDHYLHTSYAAALLLQPTREPLSLAAPAPGAVPERPATYQEALTWFEAEHSVLRASINLASRTGFPTSVWQLAWSLVTFLDRRAYWPDQAAIQNIALAAAQRAGDQCGQAHSHRNLGRAYSRLGSQEDARAHLRRALNLFRKISDSAGQARTSVDLALASERLGEYGQALRHTRRALELFRALGQRSGQADALNAVGWYRAQTGNYPQALGSCEQALTLHRALKDRPGEAGTLDSLGYIHYHLGHHQQAIACYGGSLELLRDLADPYNQAGVLTRFGDAQQSAGDQRAAIDAWQQALRILSDLQHPDADQVRAKLRPSGAVSTRNDVGTEPATTSGT
jgi:DNA-binding SARP family transcriptional activator/tetratricopeptide (TPR) repeat protein